MGLFNTWSNWRRRQNRRAIYCDTPLHVSHDSGATSSSPLTTSPDVKTSAASDLWNRFSSKITQLVEDATGEKHTEQAVAVLSGANSVVSTPSGSGGTENQSPKSDLNNSVDVTVPSSMASRKQEATWTPESDAVTSSINTEDPLRYPVQYEHYSREWMQMTGQDMFDGFRLEAIKAVTPQLQVNHSLFLGTTSRPSGYLYQFGPTFCLEDGSLFLMSRYGTDGTMSARLMKKIATVAEVRVSGNSSLDSPHRNMVDCALDYVAKDWSACGKIAWQSTFIVNGAFSQLVVPGLCLGGDLTWIAATGVSIGSIGLRYTLGQHIMSAMIARQPSFKNFKAPPTMNCHSAKFQYVHKVSDRLSLGTEFEVGGEDSTIESGLRFGYEYLFRQAKIQGLLDTTGKVTVAAQDASGFGVSGLIDYWRGDYRFGFMMQMVPSAAGSDNVNSNAT